MKRLLLTVWLTLALARLAPGQTTNAFFINDGQFNAPPSDVPSVDAINFVNNGLFNILLGGPQSFDFSDVVNFTNTGSMYCDYGFYFATEPSGNGATNMAANFINTSTGAVYANSANAPFATTQLFGPQIFPSLTIVATNVVSPGTLDVGVNGLLNVVGKTIDLSRGSLGIDGNQNFNNTINLFFFFFGGSGTTFANFGVFADYWALGVQKSPNGGFSLVNVTLPNPFSPPFTSTNFPSYTNSGINGVSVNLSQAVAYGNVFQLGPSNFSYQVVFVGNANTNMTISVGFEPSGTDFDIPILQWLSVVTNNFGTVVTNTFYLQDTFGSDTNFGVYTFFTGNGGAPELSPTNYFYSPFDPTFGGFSSLSSGNTPYDRNTFFAATAGIPNTNQFAAFKVDIQPVTFQPDPTVVGQTLYNIPGRIVLNASNYMDLSLATVSGPNYLNVTATNHFAGSASAQIESPNMDVNVGTTNGILNITNLISPYLPRFNGTIEAYSARWTNVTTAGITNEFHILMVESRLKTTALPLVQNFLVRSTNVVISDIVNVASNLLINATSLTISTNSPDAPAPLGQLNLLSPNIIWSNSLPTLQYLTNWGLITVSNNSIYLAEVQNPPYYSNSLIAPYQAVVNHGTIATSGNTTWANYFENTGSGVTTNTNNFPITTSTNFAAITSSFGPVSIRSLTAILSNDSVLAANGTLSITTGSLSISNTTLQTSSSLTFSPTNQFNASASVWSNTWSDGSGFNLLVKPPIGDILGTVLTDTSPVGANKLVSHTWAGSDRGLSVAGFSNNVALGHLIMDGLGVNCAFYFTGTSNQNALYVDQIELRDFATNITNPSIGYTAFSLNTNMMIYFADAIASGQDISERLDGSAGGRVRWVPSYAGLFSGTNVVLNGVTNALVNRALVTSKDIDSNGSGTNNYFQLLNGNYPIFNSGNVNFAIARTNHLGTNSMLISWQTLYYSTNVLRYKTDLSSTNWVTVTNFIQGPANGRVTVIDPVQASGRRFYKVEIDPLQP